MVVALLAVLAPRFLDDRGHRRRVSRGWSDEGLSLVSNVFLAIRGAVLIVIDSYLPVNSPSNFFVILIIPHRVGLGERASFGPTMSCES